MIEKRRIILEHSDGTISAVGGKLYYTEKETGKPLPCDFIDAVDVVWCDEAEAAGVGYTITTETAVDLFRKVMNRLCGKVEIQGRNRLGGNTYLDNNPIDFYIDMARVMYKTGYQLYRNCDSATRCQVPIPLLMARRSMQPADAC